MRNETNCNWILCDVRQFVFETHSFMWLRPRKFNDIGFDFKSMCTRFASILTVYLSRNEVLFIAIATAAPAAAFVVVVVAGGYINYI